MPRLLVIDDDRSVQLLVDKGMSKAGYDVSTAQDGREGLEQIAAMNPDVVLLDLVLKSESGLEVFRQIQQVDRKLPVIFITAEGNSETAIEAMQNGAYDYIAKPLDLPKLTEIVGQAARTRELMNVPVALEIADVEPPIGSSDAFIGRSAEMLDVFKTIGRVSRQNVPVLVRGESGTGKELVARAIYQHSDRSERGFVEVNCAALPDSLLESELFGHEKGAFTGADRRRIGKFEQCDGGTIFLDEIGDMAPIVQAKVLRLLQEQRFERVGGNETIETDVRIIAATNRNLEQMVEEGEFRTDLLYRLNGVTVTLPPLRERGADIDHLLQYFLAKATRELGYPELQGLSAEALEQLRSYSWPGNVRELRSVIRQAVLNSTGTVIAPEFLPPEIRGKRSLDGGGGGQADEPQGPNLAAFVERRLIAGSEDLYAETLEFMERYLLTRVLEHTAGNQSHAAEILGITRGKIRDRISAFGITVNKSINVDTGGSRKEERE